MNKNSKYDLTIQPLRIDWCEPSVAIWKCLIDAVLFKIVVFWGFSFRGRININISTSSKRLRLKQTGACNLESENNYLCGVGGSEV